MCVDEKDFLLDLGDVLEMTSNSLAPSDQLATMGGWDSLAVLRFLTMADAKYGVTVAPLALRNCETVADLMKLVAKA